MDQQNQIYLINLKGDIAFWSCGNRPTQKIFGLSFSYVLRHLKALYLLTAKVLSAASFYLESEITREVTEKLKLLFERGEILYFVDETIINFREHGLIKIDKSPKKLIAYRDRELVKFRAKELDSLGYVLRRPSSSISDRIVELWINDILSNEEGSIGRYLYRLLKNVKQFEFYKTKLIDYGLKREKDFVWEYLGPKLMNLSLSKEFFQFCRIKLSQMYSVATAEILGSSLDKPEHGLSYSLINVNSKYDTSVFLSCMDVLGVTESLEDLDSYELVKLKNSIEFILFKDFYFNLIEVTAYNGSEIVNLIPKYREAAITYLKSRYTIQEFIEAFNAMQYSLGKARNYGRPLDILLHQYELFGRLTIDDFIEKLQSISKKREFSTDIILRNGKNRFHPSKKIICLEEPMIKILFLAANPLDSGRLRLDEELRQIDEKLRMAEYREFDIKSHWAVRVSDIQGLLMRHKPDIVHFSGHGSKANRIILEDNSGKSYAVCTMALSHLFSILKDNIRLVMLNACYSEEQAKAISEHIECVVGMSCEIGDKAAISFASSFYQALGYGRDVETAFNLGCAQISLENLGDQDKPKLLATKTNSKKIIFVRK